MSPHCQGRRMFGVVRGIQLVPLQKALLDQLKQIIIIIVIIVIVIIIIIIIIVIQYY